ncbi:hypothetical protein CRUP_022766 [Coryphaenoides rupestris]|nr:hypothetical protein CRUP_022766 [Coryphaenoides rupestris]
MPSRVEDYELLVWKELDYGAMGDSEKQMLVSEVNLLRELHHPNIVRYHDRIVDRANATLYIVMEYCEGGDLSSMVARCIKDSDGGATVLHRDLKPANIFLDAKQNEQMNQMSYNEKSDIWSLGCLLYELCALSPPFTAYNQKELAEKIRKGRFTRIPYRYSEKLNTLLSQMLHLKDYLRPSVESILQSSLLAETVAEERRKAQARPRRKSAECAAAGAPRALQPELATELRLKEQLLRDREKALKEREERLEQREQELCVRERLSDEKLARVESLLKNYNLLMQPQGLAGLRSKDKDPDEDLSPGKKKVHFARDGKENHGLGGQDSVLSPELTLKKRLQAANARAQALGEMERTYQKSRQFLGIR